MNDYQSFDDEWHPRPEPDRRWTWWIAAGALSIAFWIVLGLIFIDKASAEEGRWVDFGKFAPVVRCEMGPTGDAQVQNWIGASGPFQFLQSTWDNMNGKQSWPEGRRDRPGLVGETPHEHTLATQMRVAVTLGFRVAGGGHQHWDCHRWGLGVYGSTPGDTLVWITNEFKMPKYPKRCARNLHDKWGRSWRVARSVCGVE